MSDGGVCVIFGGTGFLGRQVVRAALGQGLRVRIAARHATPDADGIEHVRADVTDEQSVARAVQGASAVVNAVALYVEKGGATFDAIHVEGAARVARHARSAGAVRLVQISGLGVDTRSPSKYVRARARGEEAVREAFGAAAVMLRPSVLFGRGDSFLTNLAALTRLPAVPLFGNGETRLQPVHVADAAAAASAALRLERARPVYELGGADVLSYREILQAVMTHLGRHRPLVPVPFAVWHAGGRVLGLLPSPPLTTDQIILMQHDSVVSGREPGFSDLGIEPEGLRRMLPECLA